MWQSISDVVMTYFDPIGVVIGIIISIPVFLTWYEVSLGRKRRQKKWLKEVRKQPGARPGILVADLLDQGDIHSSVENFRQQLDGLNTIPVDRIFHIKRDKRISADDMPALLEDIRRTAGQVLASGVDTLHYFHAGPTVIAAAIGAQFANSCRVQLYQYNTTKGAYDKFGPIRLEE